LTAPAIARAADTRTISLYNIHTEKTLTITFKRDGHFIPEALKQINWHLRDWRRDVATEMDPGLIDLVWEIHREVGSRMPIRVISGYRSPTTNEMLRKTRGGQAKRSQHLLGKAMDVQFPDVPIRTLRYSALIRQQGGVGYYPTSATPFVHIDTGRVRHWPRMGRQELALLFPSGRTLHRPASGGPITPDDAMEARRSNPALARQVVAFHKARRNGTLPAAASTAVASAEPSLIARPRLAGRPTPPQPARQLAQTASLGAGGWSYSFKRSPQPAVAAPAPQPTSAPRALALRPAPPPIVADDHSRLALLASLMPGPGTSLRNVGLPRVSALEAPPSSTLGAAATASAATWAVAPAFDEEHPEELFYRPFPIAPFITVSASADDPALQRLVHPAIDETLEYLSADATSSDRPLHFRPGPSTASLLWAQAFSGGDVSRPSADAPSLAAAAEDRHPVLGRHLVQLAGNR
jgi:uncharacterized protein YcbK (DUF882 family)